MMLDASSLWTDLFQPSVPLVRIVIRGTVVYLALFAALRLMRRQAGSIGTSDLLMVVLLADAAQNGMASGYTSITEGLVLVATILFWDYAIDWLSYHSPVLRRFLEPAPVMLIINGKVQEDHLRRHMLTSDNLLEQLREHGVGHVRQVTQCRLEGNGHISVLTDGGGDTAGSMKTATG